MKRLGLIICIVLGLLDVAGVLGTGSDDAPPVGVVIAGLVLGLLTLAAAVPAWRGSRPGLLTVVASRAVSALLGIGAFFDDAAPGWVLWLVSGSIIVTAAAIALLVPSLRERSRAGVV